MKGGLTLFGLILVLLLAPMGYLTLKPAAQLVGWGGPMKLPEVARAEPSRQVIPHNYHAPLAILILDRSGSMEKNDPLFRQSLAAHIFSYFFGNLIAEEVEPGGIADINFAVILYSELPSAETFQYFRTREENGGASVVLWPGAGGLSKWLPMVSSKQTCREDIARRLNEIDDKFERLMGSRKVGERRTGGTPYRDAVAAAQKLIDEYRARKGENAPVFAAFMTDAGFTGQPAELQRSRRSLFLTAVQFNSPAEADGMIPGFLEALEMEAINATTQCSGEGFDLTTLGKRLIPIVVKGGSPPPEFVTDTGKPVTLQARDGMYYGIFDPLQPEFANSSRLRLIRGTAREVLVFKRHQWELSLDPPVYDLLAPDEVPTLRLRYTGKQDRVAKGPATVAIRGRSGETLTPVAVTYSEEEKAFRGALPSAEEFIKCRSTTFEAVWSPESGQQLAFQFRTSRNVRVRFHKRDTGEMRREARAPFYPPVKL